MPRKTKTVTLQLSCVGFILLFAQPGICADTLFKPTRSYSSGGSIAVSVAVADLNGDGKPDLIVANGATGAFTDPGFGVGVLLGKGDGTFQAAKNYSLNDLSVISVAVADVNGDGKPDVLATTGSFSVSDYQDGGVWVLLGKGDGTFQPAVEYNSGGVGTRGIEVAGVNRDGRLDLIVTNCGPSGSFPCGTAEGNLAVLLGNGDGTFQAARTYDSGSKYAWSLAVGDVNGDGSLDLLVLNSTETTHAVIGVLLGNGDGTFQPAVTYDLIDASGGGIAVADLNADGKPDLVVANDHIGVLLGNGDGTFQTEQTYSSSGLSPDSVAVTDMNDDGKPDLLVTNYFCGDNCLNGSVDVLLGNGDGTFQAPLAYDSGGYGAFWLAVADVNGDSGPDVVVANNCAVGANCGKGVIGVLLKNSPSCTTRPVITVSANPASLWPPNGEMVPVAISGTITNIAGCAVTGATYAVTDEYGQVQPSGTVTLGARGAFSFTVLLQASRRGADLDGRLYTITISAINNALKIGSKPHTVIVPHNQGH
jgi:hypothetical protein